MASVLSVSQLNKYVSFKLSSDVKLKGVGVKGEISNFTDHYSSGHLYFTLKDNASQVRAVMFKSNASRLRFKPYDGMNVLAVGNIELYERDGQFQIVVTELAILGQGAVSDSVEKLKKKLLENGIIDEKKKKPIPLVPKKLAIVTSAGGAALQDILNITSRRYPVCSIEVFPAVVQGAAAKGSICKALSCADKSGADTIILSRGGGSAEDLFAFNEESVAMAVYNCKTPVVTAVGHETDTTVVDLVSDLRAPTPSAAAEICTPDKNDIIALIDNLKQRLDTAVNDMLAKKASVLELEIGRLRLLSPKEKVLKIDNSLEKRRIDLENALDRLMMKKENAFEMRFAQLNALSPFGVLERGYSIATKNGKVVSTSDDVRVGEMIDIKLKDSVIHAEVKDIDS